MTKKFTHKKRKITKQAVHTSDVFNGRSISAAADELKPSTRARRVSVTTPNVTIFRGSEHARHAIHSELSAHLCKEGSS